MKIDPETAFMIASLEFNYGRKRESKLKQLAKKVEWAKGWPKDRRAFWNGEAFMWGRKIERPIRDLIGKELSSLQGGKNLDLGCGSYSRVDIIVNKDSIPFVLEVNTIPGMTQLSLLPKAAKAAGIDFPELCEKMLESAFNNK